MRHYSYIIERKKEPLGVLSYITLIIGITGLILFILLEAASSEDFYQIILYFGGISYSLFLFLLCKRSEISNKKRGVDNPSHDIYSGKIISWMALGVMVFALISFCVFQYSKVVYPLIPSTFGGGYYGKKIIIIDNNYIKKEGKIVHLNHEALFLKEVNSQIIVRHNSSDISSIQILDK